MCKKCGKPIMQTEIFRSTTCEFCGADIHACVNCKFYAPGSHYDCHESIDELVKDKERANFCDYFAVAAINAAGGSKGEAAATKARDAFAALFS